MSIQPKKFILLIFSLIQFLALCAFVPQAFADAGSIQFGVVTPLTGKNADVGQDILNGIKLAVNRINHGYEIPTQHGKPIKVGPGLLGKKVKLVVEDDESRPESGMTGVRKLINDNHVPVILGTYSSGVSLPTGNYASSSKVVEIAAGSSSPKMASVGPYFFDAIGLDNLIGHHVGRFAINNSGSEKVATMSPNNPFGVGMEINACKAVKKDGGQCVTKVRYQMGQSNYRPYIKRLFRQHPGAIVFTGYGSEAGLILKQIYETHPQARKKIYAVYPTMFANVKAVKNNPVIANGIKGLMAAESGPFYQKQYVEAYQKHYGEKPASAYGAFAYDSTMLAALAIKEGHSAAPASIRKDLFKVSKTYRGVTGNKTFDKHGMQKTQQYEKVIFKNGNLEPYSG